MSGDLKKERKKMRKKGSLVKYKSADNYVGRTNEYQNAYNIRMYFS